MILFLVVSDDVSLSPDLRARNRSLNGDAGTSAYVIGGEGSWFGVVSMDCNARHVENSPLMVGCDDDGGSESGGDANSAAV